MIGRRAGILIWASNLWNFADGMLGPLFAVFASRVGGDILDITWAWSAYLIIMGVGIIIVGHVSDRVSKLNLLFAGYVVSTVCTFAYLLVDSAAMLFVVQAGLGVAAALANPTHYALLARYSKTHERDGALWGWADGRDKIAIGAAVLLGGFIVTTWSFSALFAVMGTVSLISTLYLARLFYFEKA
jgi:MFS family permease